MPPATEMVRLILDVTYEPNKDNENATSDMTYVLRTMVERTIGPRSLCTSSIAVIRNYETQIVIRPEPLSEDELADFMLKRIEQGALALEDLPVRLARYGLMEPDAFVREMRERMEMENEG